MAPHRLLVEHSLIRGRKVLASRLPSMNREMVLAGIRRRPSEHQEPRSLHAGDSPVAWVADEPLCLSSRASQSGLLGIQVAPPPQLLLRTTLSQKQLRASTLITNTMTLDVRHVTLIFKLDIYQRADKSNGLLTLIRMFTILVTKLNFV